MLRNYYNIQTAALFGSDCIIIIIHKYIHTYKNNRDYIVSVYTVVTMYSNDYK